MRNRLQDLAGRRPLALAVVLTLLWHVVLFAVDGVLPPLSPGWFPALGGTVVNLVLAGLTIALIGWLRWTRAAGLGWRRPDRTWWLAAPLLVHALLFGLTGLQTDRTLLVSTALLCAAIGTAEEAFSRGLVQQVLGPLGHRAAAVWVGVLFGLGHALSGAWFGRPWGDTVAVVVGAGCYGFCLAALRWHLGTIWPLAFLHGLDDLLQLTSPGNLPFGVRLALVCALVGYGWWLLDRLPTRAGDRGAPAVRR